MKNLLKIILLIFAFIIFTGCDKNEIAFEEDYIIKFGTECGWCAGQEIITVTSLKIIYTRNIPCGDEKRTIKKERIISSDEWIELISSFDYSLFKTLNYSECNVCTDGCDEIIEITKNGHSHELRYSISNEIEGMQNLQQILNELLVEMRETN